MIKLKKEIVEILTKAGFPGGFITNDEIRNPENPKTKVLIANNLARIEITTRNGKVIPKVEFDLNAIQRPQEKPLSTSGYNLQTGFEHAPVDPLRLVDPEKQDLREAEFEDEEEPDDEEESDEKPTKKPDKSPKKKK